MWIYFLKVNIAVALFLGIYRWLYRSDTFFGLRRYVLLSMLATAFLYPVIDLSLWIRENEILTGMAEMYTSMIPDLVVTPTPKNISMEVDWSAVATGVYWGVAAVLLFQLFRQLCLVVVQRYRSTPLWIDGKKVYRLCSHETPHSFFHWIFLSPVQYSDPELKEIVEHESVHTSQHHTIDLLVGELLSALCWVNPFAWMFKNEIRKNLEFIADSEVIDKGYDARLYQYHLLGMAQQPSAMAICNNINVSPLKERIIMLNKRRSKKMKLAAYSLLLPVAVAFVLANSATIVAAGTETVASTFSNVAEEGSPVVEQIQQEPRKVLTLVEQMPVYPGGDQGLIDYISQNTQYPAEAKAKGIKGRVICTFVVEVDGSVSDIEVLRGVDPSLDKEAVRVLKNMEKWTPGVEKGKKVAVKYNVPIMFPPVKTTTGKSNAPSTSNKNVKGEDGVYITVDEMPRYTGGDAALLQFIARNVKYPVQAAEKGIQGKVICRLVITEEGDVKDVGVLKGVEESLDKEAVRVITQLGKWTPGKAEGKAVPVRYNIPVSFRLAPATGTKKSEPSKSVSSIPSNSPLAVPGKTIYASLPNMPEFENGISGLNQYIARSVKYPVEAAEAGVQGRVIIEAVINETGMVTAVSVKSKVDDRLDAEALRVVKAMPKWKKPAALDGKPVMAMVEIPVIFRLQ